jgi:prepilin-type N-terminal cleavage/methylation domain-containing protein
MDGSVCRKKGFTLLEVTVATVIVGIMTVGGAAYFAHAARARMMARGMQAALIEANSLMERSFEISNSILYSNVVANNSGFLDLDMQFQTSDPSSTWTFDTNVLPVSIELLPVAGVQAVSIKVTVTSSRGPAVVLSSSRCCE